MDGRGQATPGPAGQCKEAGVGRAPRRREASQHLEESRHVRGRLGGRRDFPGVGAARGMACTYLQKNGGHGFSRSCKGVTWGVVGLQQEKVDKNEKDPQGQSKAWY